MPFRLESLWGATLLPLSGCAMDWDGTKYTVSQKNDTGVAHYNFNSH